MIERKKERKKERINQSTSQSSNDQLVNVVIQKVLLIPVRTSVVLVRSVLQPYVLQDIMIVWCALLYVQPYIRRFGFITFL
mmetsp:Transcript_11173/g.18300  ORF Transcript_11173/g.18300 Transcript_11173/m.18300 type:complete len:81 (+) Transcript_11173:1330-1572(+)